MGLKLQNLLFICTTLTFLMISVALAKDSQRLTFEDMITKMTSDLNLTQEQVKSIKPIFKADIAKRQEFLESLEGEPVIKPSFIKEALRRFKKELNDELMKVLTLEQMAKWKQKQALKEKLNSDNINYKEYLEEGVALNPQGGSLRF